MPVSVLPLLTLVAFSALVVCAWRVRARWMRVCLVIVAVLLIAGVPAAVYVQGLWLRMQAGDENPAGQLRYARWLESHAETIAAVVPWFGAPDVDAGFQWAQKAANGDAEAMYVVGVRLKHGIFVPRPVNWTGPEGNVFAQPAAGQPLIDRAIEKGFVPPEGVREEQYYMLVYRRK
jgi:hypothetical protein